MAGNESAAQIEGQDTTAELDKFAGFAVKDGEVIKPAAPAPKQNANAKPIGAKKAADEPAEGEDDAEPGADGGKHKSADKRISQAVGRQRAAERERDSYKTQLGTLGERLARLEGGLTAKTEQATAPKAPDPKDYDGGEYDARYLADVAKHEARAAVAEEAAKSRTVSQQAAQTQQTQARTAEFQAKRDAFFEAASEKYDDYEEVVGTPVDQGGAPISQIIGELAVDSEHGADILYELASDVKEARKIYVMSPAKQAAWFGRQEAAKESSVTSDADDGDGGDGDDGETPKRQSGPTPKVSQAPAVPESKVRGNGAVPKPSASTSDFAAFERMATAGLKKK